MGASRIESHDDDAHGPEGQAAATPDEAPTGQLLAGTVGDRCVNCGSPLAADQQYCIHCGERRGKSRFSVPDPSPTVQTATAAPAARRARRPSYGATLVAGIATLLLAMGVGVEIGRISNNNNGSHAAASPSVITVNGGGGASTGSAATTAAGTQGAPGKAQHAKKAAPAPKTEVVRAKAAAAAAKPTKAAVQKASHAASSVLGGNTGQSNATVTSGGSCTSGSAGCQNGKFTGNFFGQ
ncbi:MAG: hypothetical protein WAK93_12805 [Solirubrobacteraceae bacterium]